jgi:hypothetical protein
LRVLLLPLKSTLLLLPPKAASPQVITVPSARRAAKAALELRMLNTSTLPLRAVVTAPAGRAPPLPASPQTTTEPSLRRAAKAAVLLTSFTTLEPAMPLIWLATAVLSPP